MKKALWLYSSILSPTQLAERLPACSGPEYFHPHCELEWSNLTTDSFQLIYRLGEGRQIYFRLLGKMAADQSGSLIGVKAPGNKPMLLVCIIVAIAMPCLFVGAAWPVVQINWQLMFIGLAIIVLPLTFLFCALFLITWYSRIRKLRLGLQGVFQGTLIEITETD
ncbi:MAG TPA: hypothetical protein PLN21_19745 [Gemmatales bacterium]|nr:hypothetical protein [Gemmatales bacterium]